MSGRRLRLLSILFVASACLSFSPVLIGEQAGAGKTEPKPTWSKLVRIRDIAPKRVSAGAPTEVTITAGLQVPYPGLEVWLVRVTPPGAQATRVAMEHIGERGSARNPERVYRAKVTLNETSPGKATFQVVWSARTPQVPVGEQGRPFDIVVDARARPKL